MKPRSSLAGAPPRQGARRLARFWQVGPVASGPVALPVAAFWPAAGPGGARPRALSNPRSEFTRNSACCTVFDAKSP